MDVELDMSRQTRLKTSLNDEEILFLTNWRKEVSDLHALLTSVAAERLKILRRARRFYFKLAHGLTEQIRRPTSGTTSARPR